MSHKEDLTGINFSVVVFRIIKNMHWKGLHCGSIEPTHNASFLPPSTLPGTMQPSVVGHLPREISRFTYYVIVYGGEYHAKIPVAISSLTITASSRRSGNSCASNGNNGTWYKWCTGNEEIRTVINERYKDPVNGKFDDVTASVLKELMSDDESNQESESEMELEVAANDEAGVEPELTQQYYSVEIIMGRGGVLK